MAPKAPRSRVPETAVGRRLSRLPDLDEEDENPTSIFNPEDISHVGTPAFMYVERGPGMGQSVPIQQGGFVIGRASISDLRIAHASVSRRHAQVTREGDRFFIRDLGSQNGTYVNKTRIATEIELNFDDEVAVGNALLRLRSSPAEGTDAGASSPVRRKSKSKVWKLPLVAGVVGFALAGVLLFALTRFAGGPSYDELATLDEPQEVVKPRITAPVPKPQVSVTEPAPSPVPPAQKTKATAAETPPAKPVAAAAETSPAKSAAAAQPPPAASRRSILRKYQGGDVAGAIELAEEAGETTLGDKLVQFEGLYKDAHTALAGRDGVAAIKALNAALKADQAIAKGEGDYALELKSRLSELYVLVGLKHLEAGRQDDARKSFAAALKQDPTNTKAEQQLNALKQEVAAEEQDAEQPPPAPKKKAVRRTAPADAIEAAFED